jgi:hypothetical protein
VGARGLRLPAIVAPSFADIFYNNCTKIGLLAVVLTEADVRALAAAGEGEVDLEAQEVRFAGRSVPFEIDPEIRRRLLGGLDDIALTLQQDDRIAAYESDRERSGGDEDDSAGRGRGPSRGDRGQAGDVWSAIKRAALTHAAFEAPDDDRAACEGAPQIPLLRCRR